MSVNSKTIILYLVIKNPEDSIRNTVISFSKIINRVILVNCNKVMEEHFIEDQFKGLNFNYEIINDELDNHVFFKSTCEKILGDYILLLQPGMTLQGYLNLPELINECYLLKIGKNFEYYQPCLFKNDSSLDLTMDYMTANCDKKDFSSSKIQGDYYICNTKWDLGVCSKNFNYELGILNEALSNPIKYFNDPGTYPFLSNLFSQFENFGLVKNVFYDFFKITKHNEYNNSHTDIINLVKSYIFNKLNMYQEAFDLANQVLQRDMIPEWFYEIVQDIRDLNIEFIKDNFINYPSTIISTIKNNQNKKIMLTMTSCKRFDLFQKTVNSFLQCCQDLILIDHWFLVDDNSSLDDQDKMKKMYPFFDFHFKEENDKGHFISMNIIHQKALDLNVDYILHMEDDWLFFEKNNYITLSLKILNEDSKFGQVLFNKNYAEIEPSKRRVYGGYLNRTNTGDKYITHEYYNRHTQEYTDFTIKIEEKLNLAYWPHFSFRPSLIRVQVLRDVGLFYNTHNFFEWQYGLEYVAFGYKTTFLDKFCCYHIGGKTWEKDRTNAYALNEINQFSPVDDFMMIKVVSEIKDIGNWKEFKQNIYRKLPQFLRFVPQNIVQLTPNEKKIFNGNNFNYLRSIINQNTIHLDIMREFLITKSKYLMILFENTSLTENFMEGYNWLVTLLSKKNNYDMIILNNNHNNNNNDQQYEIIKYQAEINLDKMKGYILSQDGAKKLLIKAEINGIKTKDDLFKTNSLKIMTLNKSLININYNFYQQESISFKNLDNYKFYSQLDSFGNDISYFPNKTIEELKKICNNNPSASGFNTGGWIKRSISQEVDFIYLSNSNSQSGLYVKIK